MDKTNSPHSPCYVFSTHAQAEEAIRSLSRSGFDMKQLSLVGKGYHTEEHPMGFYTVGDRIKAWGSAGAFWGGIWGLLLAPGIFFLPGFGLMAVSGPLVTALVSALEGAVTVGGISAIGAALMQIGAPKDKIVKYETALKTDQFVLMVHGSVEEVAKANAVLAGVETLETA